MSRKPLSEEEHQRRLMFYNRGMVDADIAIRCGVGKGAITEWRKKHNLNPNGQKVGLPEQPKILNKFWTKFYSEV